MDYYLSRRSRSITPILIITAFVASAMGVGFFLFFYPVYDRVSERLAVSEDKPREMSFIEFEYVDPGLSDRFKFKPKITKLWLAGKSYLNMLEAPDEFLGIEPQFILSVPSGWVINLFTKSAKEGRYTQEVIKASSRIFPNIKEPILNDLHFGEEISFFKVKNAQVSQQNNDYVYKLSFQSLTMTLNTTIKGSSWSDTQEVPVRLDISWNQRAMRVNYLQYLTNLEFNPETFTPGNNLRVIQDSHSLSLSELGDKKRYREIQDDIANKREYFTHFYEHPNASELIDALGSYEKYGKRLGVPSLAAFLGAIFQGRPTLVEDFVLRGKHRHPDLQLEVYRGLQRCSSSICKVILEQNPYFFRHEINQRFSKVIWPPIETSEVVTNEALGELWSRFYATGDETLLARIKEIADSEATADGRSGRGRIDPRVREMFKQSLVEHAKEHHKVARFLSHLSSSKRK